jgi:uncharacterized protein involved in copper resistance
MKPLRFIPIFIAALALVFTQAVPAQSEQAAGTATQTVKKTKKKAKATAEPASEMTNKAGQSATEPITTPGTQMTHKPRTATTGTANRAATTVPESEITAAKAAGKVWVNTDTGVYHKSGQWYGATKQGKFMTEDEAIKAGYRASRTK